MISRFELDTLMALAFVAQLSGCSCEYQSWPPSLVPSNPPWPDEQTSAAEQSTITAPTDFAVVGWHFARVAGSWTAPERRAFVLGWAFGADRGVFELRGVCAETVRYDAVNFPLVNTPCPCVNSRQGRCYAVVWEEVP